MSLIIPPSIHDALVVYEVNPVPIAEIELQAALRRAMSKTNELERDERRGAWAEVAAFHFVPADGPDREPWGSYFKPIRIGRSEDGLPMYSPNADDIDPEILEYWEIRASLTQHPLLRARYADLVWEFGRLALGAKANTGFAWVAADAYLTTVERRLVEHEAQAWRFIDRALEIAIRLDDLGRVRRAKSVLFSFFRAQQEAGRLTMWWKPDEISFGHDKLELSAAEVQEVLLTLEASLARFSDPKRADQFDPQQTLAAADRLIRHRKRLDQPRQAVRCMKIAGAAVEGAAAQANPLQAIGWLEDLLRRYRELSMTEEIARAEAQLDGIRRAQVKEMLEPRTDQPDPQPIGSSAWLERLTFGTLSEVLHRIGLAFVARAESGHAADDGAKTAFAPGEADISGQAILNAAAALTQKSPLLNAALRRLTERHSTNTTTLIGFLQMSGYFESSRRRFLEEGLQAWLAGDAIKAIYLLMPEVEAALRLVLTAIGQPHTYSLTLGRVEMLDIAAILENRAFRIQVDRNIRLHLAALYSDPSGLNLQAKIARGTANFDQLGIEIANWVVHSLLLVASVNPGMKLEIPEEDFVVDPAAP
jgi:hypothetical protein